LLQNGHAFQLQYLVFSNLAFESDHLDKLTPAHISTYHVMVRGNSVDHCVCLCACLDDDDNC